ncbi:MAG: YdcH family protein [Pigmentiphaga sp.]
MTLVFQPDSPVALRLRLAALRQEHRDLDVTLQRLQHDPGMDQLALRRLKKRKLMLKDQIEQMVIMLEPDIHA